MARDRGMTDADFGKTIIAVVNSFTQFVTGYVHLRDLGKLVAEHIEASCGIAKEFNTIAMGDGIAMGGSDQHRVALVGSSSGRCRRFHYSKHRPSVAQDDTHV